MNFVWKDYDPKTMRFVEDWNDKYASNMTGLDEGWIDFHEYWITDGGLTLGKDYWCKVVYEGESPFAILSSGYYEDNLHIMGVLVKPDMRNKGLGTLMLRVFLSNGKDIIGKEIQSATSVI